MSNIDTDQYLTFKLEDEKYAFSIKKVREILEYNKITRVPQTPEFMLGVINLRGGVVPVVDLRLKFNLSATEKTVDTSIIIVEVNIEDELTVIGALADAVEEVIELPASQIEPAPKIGTRLKTDFIQGMGKYNDDFLIILNIDKIFSIDELTSIAMHHKSEEDGEVVEEEL